jgi:hypothetical protein
MKASVFYRIASCLLVLFALGHTMGFSRVQPAWGPEATAVVQSMQSVHFDVQGFSRGYWDFYMGFGLFATTFFLLTSAVTWQLGGLAPATLKRMPIIRWGLPVCFFATTILSWRYFFPAPLIFSALTAICLTCAAWLGGKASQEPIL